jgi:hypothetical protein
MKKIIALLLILSIQSAISEEAVPLQKGQPAPYTGYEIDQAKVISIRNLGIDNDSKTRINSNLTQENALLQQRVTNAQQESAALSKQLAEQRDTSFFSKAGYFIAGALVTGLIGYGVYKTR